MAKFGEAGGPAPVRVTGVSELVLEVVDLPRACQFYRDVLCLRLVDVQPDSERAWFMAGTGTRIGLWKSQVGIANGRGGVHVHFALHIDEADFDAAVAHLRSLEADPELIVWDDGRGRSAYVTDPDGNAVELWTWDVAGHLDEAPT